MNIKELLNKIKPRVDKYSDKYSWQIYQFVKKNKSIKVYYLDKSSETKDEYDIENLRWDNTYICKESHGDILGNSIISILSPSKPYELYCYTTESGYNFKDITDEFWKNYIKDGRCVLDRKHTGWWQGGGDRFEMLDEDTRTCVWCGKSQKKESYVYTEERCRWI